ncbi:MAG: N-acetylmuramoyl-L-alanine amidase, partial [Lachnospiraceae bacterium]|nr:N-acetylmuramoyl-L-alanine amidase [Lachnospiraceae bacterium]
MLIAAFGFALRGGARIVSSNRVLPGMDGKEKPCVVIDAGHGGADPGKVGVDGSLEKDINLKIAQKLALFLMAADVDVVLTRETDAGLYDENVSNKKVQDMK